ncbi:multidrug resistance protein 4, partial [Mycena amicta]
DVHDDWFLDPRNPRNWPKCKKWCTAAIVALYMFVSPLSSSTMAPGEAQIAARYGITNQSILAMTLSIFLLSFGIGPLVLAPVSQLVRRKWVLHIGNFFSILFHLGCAFAPNTATLIGFRFMAGLSGSAPAACGGAVVSDLFCERERASAMALYSLGPLLGPVLGPIAGGFIAQRVGVQYVYFTLAGATTFAGLVGIPFLRETYAPLIKLRIAAAARSVDDPEKASQLVEKPRNVSGKLRFLWNNFNRPVYLLTHSFICFTLSLYMAFIYYLFFVTFNGFFTKTYGLSTGISGLMYAGLGAGFVLATSCGAKFSNALYQHLSDKNGGQGEPEMRIPPIFVGSFFVPIGLLWYGWSAEYKLHWIMPVVGSSIFGFGMMTSFLPIQLYLVDSFKYAASALSAAFLCRSLLGFSFPLFGHEIFDKLGYGKGFTMLAVFAICLGIPFPVFIYYRGAALRARSDLNH